MIIYKTTNTINGKIYIGKDSKNDPNYYGSGQILKNAIKKYGKCNFTKEIIENCSSPEELDLKEKYWISYFDSTNRDIGYNLTDGGTGGDTFTHNPNKETIRETLRKTSSGKKHSELTKTKLSMLRSGKGNGHYGKPAWNRGIPMSNEQKQKLSKINKGKYLGVKRTDDIKNKISNSLKGKPKSTTHKEKISLKLKGRKLSENTKIKMSLVRTGVVQKKLKCPHCDKIGGTSMHRWHFENCKLKK